MKSEKEFWLGDPVVHCKEYSRVTTCLALCRAIYEGDSKNVVEKLNNYLHHMQHGISEMSIATGCAQRYGVAFKPCNKEIYIVFRGSDSYENYFTALKMFCVPNCYEGGFHDGFYNSAKLIPLTPFFHLLTLYENYSLIFTGHSLGGAIANIVAIRILTDIRLNSKVANNVHCITFGSPQVCDEIGSKYVSQRYNKHFHAYINQGDIVPHILSLVSNIRTCITKKFTPKLENLLKSVQTWMDAILNGNMNTDIPFAFMKGIFHLSTSNNIRTLTQDVVNQTCLLVEQLGKSLLPTFVPFGQYYHKHTLELKNDGKVSMSHCIKSISTAEIQEMSCNLPKYENISSVTSSCQQHFMDNYIREIYQQIIGKNLVDQITRSNPKVKLTNETEDSFLTIFTTPCKARWKHIDDNEQNDSKTHQWSIVRFLSDEQEELTLTLSGFNSCLITHIQVENTVYMEKPANPVDTGSESQRVFVLYLSLERYAGRINTSDDYPIIIHGHFGVESLKGLFDPKLFSSSEELKGRKLQVADLPIDALYRLAFTYSLFTGNQAIIDKNFNETESEPNLDISIHLSNEKRRTLVFQLLLDIEDTFGDAYEDIVKHMSSKKNEKSKEVIKYNEQVEHLKNEGNDMKDITSHDHKNKSESEVEDKNDFKEFIVTSLETLMINWQNKHFKTSTDTILAAFPRLYTMQLAFTQQLKVTTNYSTSWWINLGYAVAFGSVLTAGTSAFLYPIGSLITASMTIGGGAYYKAKKWKKQLQTEYFRILRIWATSLGAHLHEFRNHQFSLEKEVSNIYCNKFANKSNDTIINQWSEVYFPNGILKTIDQKLMKHCLKILRCIHMHYQLREYLSQDFAVGVVGVGKAGKSKLIEMMFGFKTLSDPVIRTEELKSYRVSNNFHVIDFPHATSSIDSLRMCFRCNHSLVNAIIVILDAMQQADNKGEKAVIESINKMKAAGVRVLYCFNQADRLLTQNTFKKESVNQNIDELSRLEQMQFENKFDNWSQSDHSHKIIINKNFNNKQQVQAKLKEMALKYGLNENNCKLTCFDLQQTDERERYRIWSELSKIGVENYRDIKKNWIKQVLHENGMDQTQTEQIMNFFCKNK